MCKGMGRVMRTQGGDERERGDRMDKRGESTKGEFGKDRGLVLV